MTRSSKGANLPLTSASNKVKRRVGCGCKIQLHHRQHEVADHAEPGRIWAVAGSERGLAAPGLIEFDTSCTGEVTLFAPLFARTPLTVPHRSTVGVTPPTSFSYALATSCTVSHLP